MTPLERADGLRKSGRFAEAQEEITRYLATEEDANLIKEAKTLEAQILLEMGDFRGSVLVLRSIEEPPANLETQIDFLLAKALVFSGKLGEGRDLLAQLDTAVLAPEDALRLELLRALLAARSGQCDEAVQLADTLLASAEGTTAAEANYVKGFCLSGQMDYERALASLGSAVEGLGHGYERFASAFMAGRLAETVGRYVDAARLYMIAHTEASALSGSEQKTGQVMSLIRGLFLKKMSPEALRDVIARFPQKYPADVATFALARQTVLAGDSLKAQELLSGFTLRFPDSLWAREASNLHEMIVLGTLGNASKIGLIAPLSGDLADFGESVLIGARIALSDFMAASGASIALVVRDSAGDPDRATEAFTDLVENEQVIAVIGPVLSKSFDAVAELANEYRTVAFSPSACGTGILGDSQYAFRNCLPLWTQAAAIAQYAVRRLHLLRIAVLMPESAFGTQLADSFTSAVTDLGAEIIFVKSYPAEEMDFQNRLAGLCPLEPEAIFIADYASKVAVIAPQILYHNIHDAVLLGWDGWCSLDTLSPVLGQLEGAFFVSGWWPDEEDVAVNELQARFTSKHEMDLGPLSAQSYEAASSICRALWQGAFYRQQLRDDLLGAEREGILGPYRFTSAGQAARPMHVLTVADGRIVKVCDLVSE